MCSINKNFSKLLPPPTIVSGCGFQHVYIRASLCLSVFRTISQKPLQLGSPNLIQDCSTVSHENLYLPLSQKIKGQGHEAQKVTAWFFCTLVSAGFFNFLLRRLHVFLALHRYSAVLLRVLLTKFVTRFSVYTTVDYSLPVVNLLQDRWCYNTLISVATSQGA